MQAHVEVSEMSSSRRWLIIFAIVISILVVATVSLVLLTNGNRVALLPVDTPQGTVQRYLIAINQSDYQEAYGYLSFDPSQKILTYGDWLSTITGVQPSTQSEWKATLDKTTQNGDNAAVQVTIDTIRPGGLFGNPLSSQQIIFQLSKTNGIWLITSPTYIYWIY
jgi:hypothetical protein